MNLEKKGKTKQGIVPAIKSFIWGDTLNPSTHEAPYQYQTFWQRITGTHTFNTYALEHLVRTGYAKNPTVFGIITKIKLAQKNIIFTPYWKGKPYLSKKIEFDINKALVNLLTTGTCFIYFKETAVGFGKTPIVYDTLRMVEQQNSDGSFKYFYRNGNGTQTQLNNDDLVIIPWDVIDSTCTQMGISPLQAAIMPIEAMEGMYVADTSAVKNKGVDVLITNDSDDPIVEEEYGEMDKTLNDRIGGARRNGKVATSTAKLRVQQLGRSTKELALWDGYKVKARDICTVLQVDSGLFNDPDNNKYSNRSEGVKSLYVECAIPLTKWITDNPKLIEKLGFEIYCDTSQIEPLQDSQATKAQKAQTSIAMITSINQNINNGTITREIGIEMLVMEAGYTKEEAEKLLMNNPETEEQSIDNNQNLESS